MGLWAQVLTLINGDRISMPPMVRLLFEAGQVLLFGILKLVKPCFFSSGKYRVFMY